MTCHDLPRPLPFIQIGAKLQILLQILEFAVQESGKTTGTSDEYEKTLPCHPHATENAANEQKGTGLAPGNKTAYGYPSAQL